MTPRDRNAEFEPRIVAKGQRRMDGFDQKIISLYARGMTTREMQAHFEEAYGVEVSPALISKVTDEVLDEVRTWRNRPLERLYPVVFLDAVFVKMREGGQVSNRAVYVALGVNVEGEKDVLGLWVADTKGAKFWLQVLTELRNRGVEDVLFFCVDGLKGFSEAIEAAYPLATVQLCIVHLVRASLRYVGWKERKRVAAALKRIRSRVGRGVSADRRDVAAGLGTDSTAVRVYRRGAADLVHDQRGGGAASRAQEGHEDARRVSERGGGAETAVSGDSQRIEKVEIRRRLACGAEPFCDSVA